MSKESVEQEMDEELGARTQRGELFEVDTSEYTRVEHKGLIQFVKMLPCSANDGRLQGAWKIVDHRERMVTMFQTDGRDQAEEWINRRKVQG